MNGIRVVYSTPSSTPKHGRSQIVFCSKTPPICACNIASSNRPEPGTVKWRIAYCSLTSYSLLPTPYFLLPTPYSTSLQNRRNSQLTQGFREEGGSGIRSCSTISRIAATVSRTSRRSAAVSSTSSARRVIRE